MMHEIVNEDLLKKVDNRFLLTVAAAKRSRQVQEGAHPLVEEKGLPPVLTALEEILQDKIGIRVLEVPVEEPMPMRRQAPVTVKEEAPKAKEAEPRAKKKEEKEDADSKKKQTAKSKKKKSVVA